MVENSIPANEELTLTVTQKSTNLKVKSNKFDC